MENERNITNANENYSRFLVKKQINDLKILEKQIQKAVESAEAAKERAEDAQVSAGVGKKKAAIKLLQNVTKGMADAQISAADAQKLLFEYQTKLTEISKFLFNLGVSNIAMNRSVVRELELKLKNASEEEISEFAKQELKNVIIQLKAQEDIMEKLGSVTGKVKEHAGQISYIDKQLEDIEETDSEQNEKLENIGIRLENKDKVDDKQDEKISENAKILTMHGEVLLAQKQKDAEHDEKFRAKDILDKNQDKKIIENAEKIKNVEVSLKQLTQLHNEQIQAAEKINTRISEIDADISFMENSLDYKLKDISKDFRSELDRIKHEISNNTTNIDGKLEDLYQKIGTLEKITSKKVWKIIVSVTAVAFLLLNIFQIINII